MAHEQRASASPRFEAGAKVRVRSGVTVPDFEDIPLGGWTGLIAMVERVGDRIDYEVRWDRRTLEAVHPVYRKRCERDGLELETMWLTEEDVEPDDGTPVPIEQPTRIVTPPLSERDQDDRVRKALGLTHDDPLPEIAPEALLAYHRYLTASLKFPFTAYCGEEEVGPFSRRRASMTVTGLLEGLNVEDGLVCQIRVRDGQTEFPLAEIEVGKKNPNFRLLSDYAYWFHNWPCRDGDEIDREVDSWAGVVSWTETAYRDEGGLDGGDADRGGASKVPPPGSRIWAVATLVFGVVGGLVGATIGAALGALDDAGLAAMIGGLSLGILGGILLGGYGFFFGAANRLRFGVFLGAALGSLGGGLVGVAAGLTLVALPWSLLGFLIGMFAEPYLFPQRRRRLVSMRGGALGTCGGLLISAFRHDRARATAGAVSGSITGLVVAAGLILILLGFVYLIPRAPMGHDDTDVEADKFEGSEEEEDDHGGLRLRRS